MIRIPLIAALALVPTESSAHAQAYRDASATISNFEAISPSGTFDQEFSR